MLTRAVHFFEESHIGAEFSGSPGGKKPRGAASDDDNPALLT